MAKKKRRDFSEASVRAGLLGWLIRSIRVWSSPAPAGPVIWTIDTDRYINITVSLFIPFTFSVRLRVK